MVQLGLHRIISYLIKRIS